jgi:hypothetical protein
MKETKNIPSCIKDEIQNNVLKRTMKEILNFLVWNRPDNLVETKNVRD